MPDEKGETRRQRNARFEMPSPEVEIPILGYHLWDWFWDLTARRKSGPEPITYGEIGEWQRLTGQMVRPEEVACLIAMDDTYLRVVRDEQAARHERMLEESRNRNNRR